MDLPLWDSSDDQGYLTSFAYESGNNTEDHLLRDFSFVHGRDMLEEDALNEKSCMQVLKIWIDKADEDIVKLEEDILMLKCQLVWDDEDWSEQCSAVLREKIDHLDNLIQGLKENRENGIRVETEELPPRLHDLLKPLLENYLAKPKQTEASTVQIPVPTAVELSNKKSKPSTSKDCKITEENVCTVVLKTYERKSKSTELEEREINHPQEKQNAVTTEFNASAHTCPNDDVSENFMSKPSTLDVHAESERSHVKSEPANPMENESSVSTSIEKVNSREKQEKRNIEEKEEKSNNHSKALSKAGVIPGRLQHQIKVTLSHLKLNETASEISETVEVDSMKPRTEGSSKVQKARVYSRATKGDVHSVKHSVKMKVKNTKLSETPEAEMNKTPCSMNDATDHVKMPRMELEHHVQVQQRRDIETPVVNQAKLTSPLKPECRGPQKKCKENPEAADALETEINRTSGSMNDRTDVKKPRMELEHQVQVQQRREIETLAVNQAVKLISRLKPEGRGPEKKKCQENPEAAEGLQTETNRTPCSINDRTEHVKNTRFELEHQVQVQQRRDIATVAVNQATKLISPLIPEGRGLQKKWKAHPEAAEALQTENNRSSCSMNDRAEHVKKPRLELEHEVQVQHIRHFLNVGANQAKLISPFKPEGRGPQIKCQEIPKILQNSFEAEHIDKGPSSTENLMEQNKNGVAEGMNKNGKKETQQQWNKIHIAGTSVVTATPILLPKEVRRLSFSPQTTCKKEDLTSSRMKLPKKEHDASNSTAEETTDDMKNMPQASSPCEKIDKMKITCSYLKAIAKSRNLRGYSKLKKEELLKLLGFS